jgi:glycerol-3-phosphate acyltransferase PlsY
MDMTLLIAAGLVLGAYLLGSVSSAIIVCRLMGLPDPRTQGSNNPGATNVLRIGGSKAKPAAAITLAGDMLKGLIPMLVAHLLQAAPLTLALVGIAAFVGHLFPVFFGFRGGKGVATAMGVQFGLYWPIGVATAAVWLFVAKVLKISSISALLSMALAPVFVWLFWPEPKLIGMQIVITGLLFLRHRENIRRLIRGDEDAIGTAKEPDAEAPVARD